MTHLVCPLTPPLNVRVAGFGQRGGRQRCSGAVVPERTLGVVHRHCDLEIKPQAADPKAKAGRSKFRDPQASTTGGMPQGKHRNLA